MEGYKFRGSRNYQFSGKTKKERGMQDLELGIVEEVRGCGRFSGAEMAMYTWGMIKFNLTGAEEYVLAECSFPLVKPDDLVVY